MRYYFIFFYFYISILSCFNSQNIERGSLLGDNSNSITSYTICSDNFTNPNDCYIKSTNFTCCYYEYIDLKGCYWIPGLYYGNFSYHGVQIVCSIDFLKTSLIFSFIISLIILFKKK